MLELGTVEYQGSATAAVEPRTPLFPAEWDRMVSAFFLHNFCGVFVWKQSPCMHGSVPVTSQYVIEQFLPLSTNAFESGLNALQ